MAYTIQKGDTLSGIATKNKTTVQALMQANPSIKDPNKIAAGASLNIPGTPAQSPSIINQMRNVSMPQTPQLSTPMTTPEFGQTASKSYGFTPTPPATKSIPQQPEQSQSSNFIQATNSPTPPGYTPPKPMAPTPQTRGVTGQPSARTISQMPTGNQMTSSPTSSSSVSSNAMNTGQVTGQTTGQSQGVMGGAQKPFGMSEFSNAMDTIRSKLAQNNDLIKARQALVTQLYDHPLTQQEIQALPENLQQYLASGDNRMIEMNIRLLNDQIQGRTNTIDQSVNYLTTAYKDDMQRADEQKQQAMSNVMDFVKQYGSQAGDALKAMYGDQYVQQLKDLGIDVSGAGNLPKTLAEQKLQPNVAGSLSPEALDMAANQYLTSGTMPSIGMGTAAAATRAQILNRAAQLSGGANPALNKAAYDANKSALTSMQKLVSLTQGYETKANSEFDLMTTLSDKVDRTGSPMLNKWLLDIRNNVTGDPDTAAFKDAIETAANEYAKVIAGSTGSAGATDSARQEALGMLNSAMTPQQLKSVVQTLRQSMENASEAYQGALDNIKMNMAGSQSSDFWTSYQGSSGISDDAFWSSFSGEGSGSANAQKVAEAIGMIESSGNYKSVGPPTQSGDKAYGKYQVMGANIPQWTKQVLGYSMTPQQFLNDPEAQDQVAQAKMSEYLEQYGNPDDVASLWFSGRPLAQNTSKDVTGTSVPEYVRRFRNALDSLA